MEKQKITKVYAVEVNYPEKIETGNFFGLFNFGTTYAIRDRWEIVGVFSTKKYANKIINEKNFSFSDEERGTRITEWEIDDKDIIWINDKFPLIYKKYRLDYEFFCEEWNEKAMDEVYKYWRGEK